MGQNPDAGQSAELDFPNEDEREVADILVQLSMLSGKSNLTLFLPVWITKGRRSAMNRRPSPSTSATASRPDQVASLRRASPAVSAVLCSDLRSPVKVDLEQLPSSSSKPDKTAPFFYNEFPCAFKKAKFNNGDHSRYEAVPSPQQHNDVL